MHKSCQHLCHFLLHYIICLNIIQLSHCFPSCLVKALVPKVHEP
nr:MAG TPA: hypothetical protein [Caudoviricetes sp.]